MESSMSQDLIIGTQEQWKIETAEDLYAFERGLVKLKNQSKDKAVVC